MLAKLMLLFVCVAILQKRAEARGLSLQNDSDAECVVLLHGMGRTSVSMKRIEWSLKGAGYRVINCSCPSRRLPVEKLVESWLHPLVRQRIPAGRKVHFVTHSLGGIIVRQYLSNHPVENLGRVVMFAPPNHGSELADQLKRTALGRWVLGPSGCQLGTGEGDLPQRLGPVNFELGVLAGDRSLNLLLSKFLTGPNDGKVSVASAQVAGMSDFAVLHSSHTWMQWRSHAIQQVTAFLQHGAFHHPG